jgi:molecular chaperone DnaK
VDGENLMPSVVGRDPGSRELLVGKPARNQYIVHPRHTVRSIKRRMGKQEQVSLGDERYRPEEISALILGRLKSAAEAYLQSEAGRAVITVPAYFDDFQRRATKKAGELAGLEVVRLLNEPTAAALAHGLAMQEDQIWLVYDLGGGTFDVSIVEKTASVMEVLASHGNTALGGDDFDQIILKRLIDEFHQSHQVDLSKDLSALARLTFAAERTKIALSDEPFAAVSEEFIATRQGKPLNLAREVERRELEEWIRPLVESTRESIDHALRDAGISRDRLQKVILVGGSTHIPLVWQVIEESLGQVPHAGVDPALAVALGAAAQAGIIAGEPVDMILVDVAAHSLGIEVLHDSHGLWLPNAFSRIIPRNTAIPVRKSEVYFTSCDNQEKAEIKIYQGEHEIAPRNTYLGEFLVEGLTRAPAGAVQIVVSFDYDANGMLQVKAHERGSADVRELTVTTLGTGIEPRGAPAAADAPASAAAVLDRARSVLMRASEEDRRRIEEAVARLEQAIAARGKDVSSLEQALLDILYEIA